MKNQDTIPKRIRAASKLHADTAALMVKDDSGIFQSLTYREIHKTIASLGAGLHKIGINRGDHVAIISDNRMEWILTDLALLGIGAIDIPRGSDSTDEEIAHILEHSESSFVFAENAAQVRKILSKKEEIQKLTRKLVFSEKELLKKKDIEDYDILSFAEIMDI